jgi:Flp pilus assembly protein TadD
MIARFTAAKRGGLPDADKPLSNWIAQSPADADVVSLLAEYKASRGDKAGAIALYEQAVEKSPANGELLNNLAMLYIATGDGRAVATAEKANKLLPDNPAALDTYGWALFQAGKYDQAVHTLRDAARGLPDNAEVQYHLAAALAKSGSKAEGLAGVKKALGGSLPPAVRVDAQKLLAELSK